MWLRLAVTLLALAAAPAVRQSSAAPSCPMTPQQLSSSRELAAAIKESSCDPKTLAQHWQASGKPLCVACSCALTNGVANALEAGGTDLGALPAASAFFGDCVGSVKGSVASAVNNTRYCADLPPEDMHCEKLSPAAVKAACTLLRAAKDTPCPLSAAQLAESDELAAVLRKPVCSTLNASTVHACKCARELSHLVDRELSDASSMQEQDFHSLAVAHACLDTAISAAGSTARLSADAMQAMRACNQTGRGIPLPRECPAPPSTPRSGAARAGSLAGLALAAAMALVAAVLAEGAL